MNINDDQPRPDDSAAPRSVDFTVFETEPLMRFCASFKAVNAATLTAGFYGLVTIPMCVWSAIRDPVLSASSDYISFFDAISWSLSVIFLLPFVVGLTFSYYSKIPRLFEYLFREIVQAENDAEIDDFLRWLRRRFNTPVVPVILFLTTLLLVQAWVIQELNQENMFWGGSGTLAREWLGTQHGLSWIGVYAVVVATVLVYWILNLGWRGLALAWGLTELFNRRHFSMRLEPLHPDGACGLRPIGSVAFSLNVILFLIGMLLSLTVIDRIVVQDADLLEDPINLIMLGAYAIFAPLLFFLPLAAAHRSMLEARDRFLQPISTSAREAISGLRGLSLDQSGSQQIESLRRLESLRTDLRKKIPVWPFDFRTLQAFFGTIVVPLLPLVLPLLTQLLKTWIGEDP